MHMSQSSQLNDFVEKVRTGQDLQTEEASKAALALTASDVEAETKKTFLLALAEKGESPVEVAGFADAFRELARDPGLSQFAETAIDVVGTGGDKSGSFNISSATSFLLAASGVPVLKHGNRSITSKCGSAQIIDAIGVDIEANNDVLLRSVQALNFTFFFAPAFHPAFKEIMPVRQALAKEGKRTIFNILGPLINPGQPAYQLLGIFSKAWVEPYANAAHQLGLKRGLVVHCALSDDAGMDELSAAGVNHVTGFGDLNDFSATWKAEDFGLKSCDTADLNGGDVEENLAILTDLANGTVNDGLKATLAMNVGAALWVTEKVESMEQGVAQALSLIESDALSQWLAKVKTF